MFCVELNACWKRISMQLSLLSAIISRRNYQCLRSPLILSIRSNLMASDQICYQIISRRRRRKNWIIAFIAIDWPIKRRHDETSISFHFHHFCLKFTFLLLSSFTIIFLRSFTFFFFFNPLPSPPLSYPARLSTSDIKNSTTL